MSRWLGRTVQSGTFSREGGPAVGVDRGSQRTGPRQGGRPAAEVSWLTRLATQTGSPPKKCLPSALRKSTGMVPESADCAMTLPHSAVDVS